MEVILNKSNKYFKISITIFAIGPKRISQQPTGVAAVTNNISIAEITQIREVDNNSNSEGVNDTEIDDNEDNIINSESDDDNNIVTPTPPYNTSTPALDIAKGVEDNPDQPQNI